MPNNLQPFQPDNFLLLHHHHPSRVSGFGFYRWCRWNKKRRDNYRAVERDSEYEIDPEVAREALRKLDQQLQKQTKPVPKPKASNPYDLREEATTNVQDTGSYLPITFFGLLIFTIVYNIIFIKVIKPSIDGPQAELAPVRPSLMRELLKAELLPSIQLPPSSEVFRQP
uniref:uncharacterized protein LOC122584862 n=1 Tax=Erigeron canadensis TaxID=72917 RepID=UPI001CB95A0C|nr:uncharacterized protein LOC122584862 [Erigeron canadensis]